MAKKEKRKAGRPESEDPKILFPSFRMKQSQVKAIQAKAIEDGKSLSEIAASKLAELIK